MSTQDGLDRTDFASITWTRVVEHINARIAELREENDSPTLDERMTAFKRGRISELKELLALETAPVREPGAYNSHQDANESPRGR